MTDKKMVVMQIPGISGVVATKDPYEIESEILDPIGAELLEVTEYDTEKFIQQAGDAHAIITAWGRLFSAEVIEQLENCEVIAVGSIGVDMVDMEAATKAGILVTNTPDVFIEEVADQTMTLLLGVTRKTKLMSRLVEEGEWWDARAICTEVPRLRGQTLGLVGFGNVARATARRAQPFGLQVIAYDPYVAETVMCGQEVAPVNFKELLEQSDFLSVHTPLNDETHHMIGAKEFKAMKATAALLNTARGPIIDEQALIQALQTGEIAAAGIDVAETEPPAEDNPLRAMDNVLVTPHSAAATTRARPEARRRAAREVALVLSGRWPMSCVNPWVIPQTKLTRWQPYSMDRGPGR